MIELIAQNASIRWLSLLVIFGLVVFLSSFGITAIGRRLAVRSELSAFASYVQTGGSTRSLRERNANDAWSRLAAAIEAAGLNLTDTKNERLSARLRMAGYDSPSAPRVFTLIRLVMIFALPLAYILASYMGGNPPSFLKLYLFGTGLALLGLYLPNVYVQAKADRRTEEIVNAFPDCLDLLLVCVESGLGLEAAMDRVGREMVTAHPLVARLLSVTVLQLRAGASREEAFRKMADEAGVEDIRSFTTLIIQSDKLGTSIAATLRVYAAEMREKRQMRAEEKAHRLPVLLSIPLVVCMLPTMIGTLMLPAVVMVVRKIFPMMMG